MAARVCVARMPPTGSYSSPPADASRIGGVGEDQQDRHLTDAVTSSRRGRRRRRRRRGRRRSRRAGDLRTHAVRRSGRPWCAARRRRRHGLGPGPSTVVTLIAARGPCSPGRLAAAVVSVTCWRSVRRQELAPLRVEHHGRLGSSSNSAWKLQHLVLVGIDRTGVVDMASFASPARPGSGWSQEPEQCGQRGARLGQPAMRSDQATRLLTVRPVDERSTTRPSSRPAEDHAGFAGRCGRQHAQTLRQPTLLSGLADGRCREESSHEPEDAGTDRSNALMAADLARRLVSLDRCIVRHRRPLYVRGTWLVLSNPIGRVAEPTSPSPIRAAEVVDKADRRSPPAPARPSPR